MIVHDGNIVNIRGLNGSDTHDICAYNYNIYMHRLCHATTAISGL